MRNILIITLFSILFINPIKADNYLPTQKSIAPITKYDLTYFNLLNKNDIPAYRASSLPFNFGDNSDVSVLRNADQSFGVKLLRGSVLTLLTQKGTLGVAMLLPKESLNWEPTNKQKFVSNFKRAYTKPPVIDDDYWWTNYVGHPYQGSTYYNAYRSQGADFWQSAIMTTVHSTFWEYVLEAGFEQPSIQDLIVTPIAGSIVGELTHRMTMHMRKGGFSWYEKIAVTILNPMYVLNNGFKVN